MKLVILLLIGLIIAAQGRSLLASDDKPDTPPYEVKNSTKALEVRQYGNATWVLGFGRSRWAVDFAAISAGKALAKYFNGGNVEHIRLAPTIPLLATVLRPPHPPHHKNGSHPPPHKNGTHPRPPPHKPHHPPGPPAVALGAYIPKKYQGKAPLPDVPRVKIVETNSTEVYVHKFGGWAISWVVKHEIRHLKLALKDVGICARKGKFFVATYDGPFKIFGRHNEVMWVKRPKHRHHNETLAEDNADITDQPAQGWEAFDVEALFQEEFDNVPNLETDRSGTEEPQAAYADQQEGVESAMQLDYIASKGSDADRFEIA